MTPFGQTMTAALVCGLFCASCQASGSRARDGAAAEEHVGYPKASWRYAPEETNAVRLYLAHILVAHRETAPADAPRWFFGKPATRTKAEARHKALQLRRALAADPSQFERLAQSDSDDPSTAARSGRLGLIQVSGLPFSVLDALAALRPDEISRPVETSLGYHLLKMMAVPPNERVAGRQIVIARDSTVPQLRPDHPPHRTQEQARALAETLSRELAQHPDRFEALAVEHSDTFEALTGGDLGAWSSHDDFDYLALDMLRELAVNQIARPFEDASGFRILQRTADVDRPAFEVEPIVITHAAAAARDPGLAKERSPAEAEVLAQDIAAQLRAQPSRFAAMRRQFCEAQLCAGEGPKVWMRGKRLRGVDARVEAAAEGAIVGPINSPIGFIIARRGAQTVAQPAESAQWVFAMPHPSPRTMQAIIADPKGEQLSAGVRAMKDDALTELHLPEATAAQFANILNDLAASIDRATPPEREKLIADAQQELRALLGPERHQAYVAFRQRWIVRKQFLE